MLIRLQDSVFPWSWRRAARKGGPDLSSTAAVAPWFPETGRSGLRDFWDVYSRHYETIVLETRRGAKEHAELGSLVRAVPEADWMELNRQSKDRLQQAVDGDWAAYENHLRQQAQTYAHGGLSFTGWYDLSRDFARHLQPLLVAAYSKDPERLIGALNALRELLDRSMAIRGQAYIDAKSALLEEQSEIAEARAGAHAAVLETAIDCIVTMDHEGRVREWNPAAERTFGYSRDHAIGRRLAELIIPSSERDAHTDGLARFLSTGRSTMLGKRLELTALRADQTEFPVEVTICQIVGKGPPIFTGFIRDITERRRAEQLLQRSEARYARISQSGLIGVVVSDTSGKISEANDEYLRIVGYSREELLSGGVPSAGLTPPEWEPSNVLARAQLKETGVALPWEKEFIRKDGSRVPVVIGVTLIDPPNCISLVLDASARQQAERAARTAEEKSRRLEVEAAQAALRQSEERFRLMVESVQDYAIFMLDTEARVSTWNVGAERIKGYQASEIIGQPFSRFYPVEDAQDGKPARELQAALESGRFQSDGLRLRKDGSLYWANGLVTVLRDTAGGLRGFGIVTRDITERRQADLQMSVLAGELTARAHELEVLNKELEAFSYSVSHDLRGPLRALDGFSHALLVDYATSLDEQGKNHLARIRRASQKMGQLIDDLLKLSRITRTELQCAPVDLSRLALQIVQELRDAEPDRQIAVEIAPGLHADGDPELVGLVLQNLIGNAWKFTSKRALGSIQFGICQEPEALAYFVRDNGAGFDMAYAAQLFGAFQRLHSMKEFQGNGIGLATVRRIVHHHGGEIWARAEVGKGATFFFTLKGK